MNNRTHSCVFLAFPFQHVLKLSIRGFPSFPRDLENAEGGIGCDLVTMTCHLGVAAH